MCDLSPIRKSCDGGSPGGSASAISTKASAMKFLIFSSSYRLALRHPGTHAGADVPTQSIFTESTRLSQDDAVPEMAANGGSAR